jgi:hypothetical protein
VTGWAFTAYGPAPGTAPAGVLGPGQVHGGTGPWLLPAPSREARSYQSRGVLTGQPGTMFVPAPPPASIPPGNAPTLYSGDIAYNLRGKMSSRDAPDYWLPAIYSQRVLPNGAFSRPGGLGLGPNVSVVSDNQLPVPAIDPRGRPAVMAQRPARIGGRGQVVQPYAVTAWPKFTRNSPLAPA